ncbi:hypothetical protein ABW21_db0204832 [Orbilia brochopaga]|nr:hypothetical protein ABW21_db0204832 [Drechslerella brochopaga]
MPKAVTNILLTGIYSDAGLEPELFNIILDLSRNRNLRAGKYHKPGSNKVFSLIEPSLRPRGKVAPINIPLNSILEDEASRLHLPADQEVRVDFLFDGPAIWRDEWFNPEYFETLMAARPLDGICLIMKDWPPEGDYRLSRWLEWVNFYQEILAPIWEKKIDVYVLFLFEASKDHMDKISVTATTHGLRCFIVGNAKNEYVSGVSAIDSLALTRWLMALTVDINMLEEPPMAESSKGKERGNSVQAEQGSRLQSDDEEPVLADLDEDDPLAGVDLSGFKVEYEDDNEEESQPFTTIDDEEDPLAGVNLEGFKMEFESDEDEDDIDPPDTAENARADGGNGQRHDPNAHEASVHDVHESPKKPLRLGESHQFLRSIIQKLRVAFEREIEKVEGVIAPIQASLQDVGEQLRSLSTNLELFQDRRDKLSRSTQLVCGRTVTRNHHMKLLDPCPRTFRFDEEVDFPIKAIREIEISGKKDPKVWGIDPKNPKKFVGNVKNDIYRSAKCRFELLGYEKDVRAKTIKELDATIRELSENIETCKNQRDVLNQELEIANAQELETNAQLALCNLDLDTLQDSASLDWDITNMKEYLKKHSLYGIAKEYGLCSVAKASFHAFDQHDLKNYKILLKGQGAAMGQFSDGIGKLSPILQQTESKAEEALNDIGNLMSDIEVTPQYTKTIKKIDQDLSQLEKRKRLWRPHFSELDALAAEAKDIIAKLGSERMEIMNATSALQNKVKTKASNVQSKEATSALAEALVEVDLDLEVLVDVQDILEADLLDVGTYATMEYQNNTRDGLVAIHEGVATRASLRAQTH